jgi:hypothetical protein
MNLKALINEFDPGHFDTRRKTLERRRNVLIEQGYDVKPISEKNIDCFWLTLEHKGRKFNITDIEDIHFYIEAIDSETQTNTVNQGNRNGQPFSD